MSSLSTSLFKLLKLDFKANEDVSPCVIDFKLSLVANPSKSKLTVTFFMPDSPDE